MKLSAFLKPLGPAARADFAVNVGTTLGHLNNVSYGTRKASAALTRGIADYTNRRVAEWDLRADDWWRIWPELIGAAGAPPACPWEPLPAEPSQEAQEA
jgi:hypothetical protein